MSTATLTWEQYQKLPPSKRSRPLTPAEYAALTRQQRAAAGLEDDESAPANFGGAVFPNPDHIQVRGDDEPPIDATRLPNGASFSRQNYTGGAQMDVSNPDPAQVIPSAMGREIQAKTTGAPMKLPPGAMLESAPAENADAGGMKLPPGATLESAPTAENSQTENATEQDSALMRFGKNFLSGLGVTSNEDAKNFFEHPIDTALRSLNAQGELAVKARDAYKRGDYKSAVIHGINYLLPFVGPQLDQAGQQLSEGDIAGGAGRTLGVAAPMIAGSPEVRTAAGNAASAAGEAGARTVRAAARGANVALKKAPGTIGGSVGAAAGGYVGGHIGAEVGAAAGAMAGRELLPEVRIPGEGFGLPNRVTGGPAVAPKYTPGQAGSAAESVASKTPAAESAAESVAGETKSALPETNAPISETNARPTATPSGAGVPRTLSGESVLREELTKQPNNILLKIAKSRGVNVSQESLLKPSNAVNNRIINKIVEDFSPDELDELRSRRLDAELNGRHDFGDIGKEANQTLSLQTYFPELKIPAAQQVRTATAIRNAEIRNPLPETAPVTDVAAQIKNTAKTAAKAAKPRTVVVDPATGRPEFSDVLEAKQNAAQNAPAAAAPAAAENDLTAPMQKMLDEVQRAKPGSKQSILKRLAKGEAGQAGMPGSVTDADEGIADIQNRPVLATKTGEVPARGFLRTVGADENSVLKTQKDLDSVFYHRQQIAKNGTPAVELHVDEDGNVIGAQGRHRAIAAVQQGGPNAKVRVTIYKHPVPAVE